MEVKHTYQKPKLIFVNKKQDGMRRQTAKTDKKTVYCPILFKPQLKINIYG
tara:strand:- start:382 stop:534 length:153 start_codon:yes stop_codon:yes gene_type:complete